MKHFLTIAAIRAQNPSMLIPPPPTRLHAPDVSPIRRAVTFIEYLLLAGIAVVIGGLILGALKLFVPQVFTQLTSFIG
jgi:hypothetical protein